MADDIDVLGQSLLNRQRTNRKRADKRSRKERNINLGLNLAAKGVGYANTYLKNRADTFVNEQEELVGSRMRQQKAIARSQSIIEDYTKAQEYATGPEGYLAQMKFAPIIRANFERDFGDTTDYSKTDIDNWVYETAAVKAKENIGSFNSAYDAAMSMGNIEDYDAYVKTKDGRAENVGGFLFNKLTRSLNNKTQADIDQEVTSTMRTNRFTDRADQVLLFDGYLNAGYTSTDAKNLAKEIGPEASNNTKSVLARMGINEAESVLTSLAPQTMSYYQYGSDQKIQVQVATYTKNGRPHRQVYLPFKDINGNYDEDSFNFFMNATNEDPVSSARAVNTSASSVVTPEVLAGLLDPDNKNGWVTKPPVKGTPVTSTDGFARKGYKYTQYFYNRNDRSETRTPVYTITTDRWDTELTELTPIDGATTALVNNAINKIENVYRPEGDEDTIGTNNVIDLIGYGTDAALEKALEDDSSGTKAVMANNRAQISRRIWSEQIRIMEESMGEFSATEALDLATSAIITPYVLAYKDEQIHNNLLINYKQSRNVALLIGESQLSANLPSQWNDTPPILYNKYAIGSLVDIKKADENVAAMLVNQLRSMAGYGDILVPMKAMPSELSDAILTSGRKANADGEFTFEQLVSHAAEEPVQQAANPPANNEIDIPFVAANISGYELPATNSRRAAQEDDARRFQSLPNDSTPSATDVQRARIVGRQDNAAKEIQELLLENKLPSKDRGLNRAKINSALRSDVLTDEEKRVLNTWLGKDSPKVTTEDSDTTAPDSEPFSGGNISEERAAEISFPSDTSASSLIKRFENFTPVASFDVRQDTNGFGTAATNASEEITMEEAQERLLARVAEDTAFIENFNEQYQYDWTENETIALTSFIFNLGKGSLDQVTEGGTRSKEEIADAMLLYTGAGDTKNIPGLVKRRQDEYDIFTGKVTI